MNKYIKSILLKIEKSGYEAYVVGGYVRDLLIGRKTTDIDICTNALPIELKSIFKDVKFEISSYGNIKIRTNKYTYEITTYRNDINYKNGKLTKLVYSDNLLVDIKRRDFTINSILMNSDGDIIDLLNGKKDIQKKNIKVIGNPDQRFLEDPLRMMRAIRLSTSLNFQIDKKVKESIIKNKKLFKNINKYKLKKELDKILVSENVKKGLELITELKLNAILGINSNKIIPINNSCAMYAQLQSIGLPFSKNEKQTIETIKKIVNHGNVDSITLYKYDLYENLLASQILRLETKHIYELYGKIVIHKFKDININSTEICQILDIKPSSILKNIKSDLEYQILNNKLINEKQIIIEYLQSRGVKYYENRQNNKM